MVAENWPKVRLSDLIDIRHGYAFLGENIKDYPSGDILLTPGNFAIGGGFKGDKFKYFDGPIPNDYILKQGDLIITMTDLSKQADTLGYPAIVPQAIGGKRFLHNQRLGKVIIRDAKRLDILFLFYLLRTSEYRHEVLASATGTTVKHTSPSRILAFEAQIPPLPEQRAIAVLLGSLDDKIELNRQMNETLEAMAWVLFKDWFIDFSPVRAKMEGRQPVGLAADIAAIFPGTLDARGKPEGWSIEPLSAFIELIGGGTPKTSISDYWDGDIPWFSVVDAPSSTDIFVTKTQRNITQLGLSNSSTRLLPEGTTIISARGTVGKLAVVGKPMAMNQSCYAISAAGGWGPFFIYFLIKNAVQGLQSNTHGSVFDTITRNTFNAVAATRPSQEIGNIFENVVTLWMDKIKANLLESETLASIRDILLPRLLSGEIRISDFNHTVPEE